MLAGRIISPMLRLANQCPVVALARYLTGCSGDVFSLDVAQTRSFATQVAQIVELRAAHFGRSHDFDFINNLRTLGENALYALAEADFAHGKTGLRPAAASDHHAFKSLQTLFIALFDFHLHPNSVARTELRQIGAFLLGKKSLDDLVRHDVDPLALYELHGIYRSGGFGKPLGMTDLSA